MNDPCDLSIREAGDHLRSGKLSAIELTESALRRIDQTEPAIHAYVRVLDEEALAAARQADDDLQAGRDLGPLHGMPIGIKDIFDVEGLATGCGSQTRDGVAAAATDAEVVAKLRAAGAIILGKTVTQEFAAGVVSPPTRNPWDPDRIPGGSSGGSAAAVAAGSCLGALGSDTGGSIRIPAAVTGAVGLKPTFGTVSKRGVFPLSWSLDTVGPLARTVEDAGLLLNAIGGDALDDATAELGLDLRGIRLGVARPHFFERVQSAVASAVEAALGLFAELGAKVIETPWDAAGSARAAGFVINRVETLGVHGRVPRESLDRYGPELLLRLDATRLFPASHYIDALRARTIVRDSAARLFAAHELDALLVPTLPATAVPAADLFVIHDDGQRESVAVAYTRLTMPFNATGQPALSVPCGFDADGLPIGLQIVARPFAEARLCRIGHAYERASGWRQHRPPLIGGKAGAQ